VFAPAPPARPRPATDWRAPADADATAPPAAEPALTPPSAHGGRAPIRPDPVAAALAAAAIWTSSEPEPHARRTAHHDDEPAVVARAPATAPPAAERPANVHIGSIAVEVVTAPESRQPDMPAKTPAPTPAAVAVLAHKFTSHYGLRQR
jgi:hypothetical protein